MSKVDDTALTGPSLPDPSEGLALLSAFHRVLDPLLRQQIVSLIKALAHEDGSGGLSPAAGNMHGPARPFAGCSISGLVHNPAAKRTLTDGA